jgi:hypothetical protein
MTWNRLYALTSGGAVVVTALAALVSPVERSSIPAATPQALDKAGAVVDLGAQAERLKARLAEVTAYRQPARDAFQFGPPPRRVEESPRPSAIEAPPAVVAPVRPPYALAGMATTTENGVAQRTAILSSLQGVSMVKEGETLETGYRVMSIADDSVTLESSDGIQTTLRLSNTDQSR